MKYSIEQIESFYKNYAISITNNEEFDKNGFLVVKNICNPEDLIDKNIPEKSGIYRYFGAEDKVNFTPEESQVLGSISRYYFPKYKKIHLELKNKIQNIIGKKLYKTYYYDRFYFPGQELTKHVDRDACEISISVHIGTNLKDPWPFYIKNLNGEDCKVLLNPGDGVIYKGCEREHWRNAMPGKKRNLLNILLRKEKLYYHQIFFHYVLSDGHRVHCADDFSR